MPPSEVRSPEPARRPRHFPLYAALVSAVLLAACAGPSIRTHGDPDFALAEGTTYAWASSTPGALLDDLDARRRWGEFRATVDEALVRRGATRVDDPAEASLLVDLDLALVTEVRTYDPYFNLYVAERSEEADLVVRLLDAADREVVWRGECRHRLRFLERAMGGHTLKWYPVDAERDWRVDEIVTRIFERIPAEQAAGAG